MPIGELKSLIGRLPEQPGVYLFLSAGGETIYVGKARALRDRVRSYLSAHGASPKTDALLEEAAGLDFVVTDSVVEALALENHLIKQRMPKFNILLRDDKNYPYLKLTVGEPCPRILVARRVERDGHLYAGPFLPASLARTTMGLTHRLFGIRSCNEEITGTRARPCLEYDIKRCVAPCVSTICPPADYARAVEHARLFLEGRNEELEADLAARMAASAAAERFEEAAHLRDALRTIEALAERYQKMATAALGDRDAFGLFIGPAGALIQVFQMRRGRVIERVELAADTGGAPSGEDEILQAAVQQFYETREPPPDVFVPTAPAETEVLATWLSERAGRRVRVSVPKRGERRGLLDLAMRNAAIAYRTRSQHAGGQWEALDALRVLLSLPAPPRRVEGFDISTIQGRETVASLVVAEDGRMKRGEYRKYRVQGLGARGQEPGARDQELGAGGQEPGARGQGLGARGQEQGTKTGVRGPDDVASMREVVFRRYRRVLEQGGPFPDLILIDGGLGQLSAAYAALERLGLGNLVAVGLAKREELIVTRDRREPIALAPNSPALLFLQRVRDEAHRFAVTFHRQARARRDLGSELDGVPGVGLRRRQALLSTFGSLAGVRRASLEDLAAVVGPSTARAIAAHFDRTGAGRL